MGGEIDYESEPGEGSRFWFTVPCEEAHAAIHAAAALAGVHALVVDAVELTRAITERQLASFDMRFAAVESGEQALAELRSAASRGDPYQLVLADLSIPGMDALELAGVSRSRPELGSPGVLVLTSAPVTPRENGSVRRQRLLDQGSQPLAARPLARAHPLGDDGESEAGSAVAASREPRPAR